MVASYERSTDLGNLPWFDYDKIKDTGLRCKAITVPIQESLWTKYI